MTKNGNPFNSTCSKCKIENQVNVNDLRASEGSSRLIILVTAIIIVVICTNYIFAFLWKDNSGDVRMTLTAIGFVLAMSFSIVRLANHETQKKIKLFNSYYL